MKSFSDLLQESAALHKHLCPRQVLGVRMGIQAGEILGLDLPQGSKRLLTIVETDGCASDGIAVATNCWVGRRTMRVVDFGKVAATFVDTELQKAIRIVPHLEARGKAKHYAPEAHNRWEAQLLGYQRMPVLELLAFQSVRLNEPLEKIISRPGMKAVCSQCLEEILNEREVIRGDTILCQACAGFSYYTPTISDLPVLSEQPEAIRCD